MLLTALFAFGTADAEPRLEQCAACHGEGGNSRTSGIPSIAGQPKLFLETQLILFREGLRVAPQKEPVVKGLRDGEIRAIAEHFSSMPRGIASSGAADPGLAKLGQNVAQKHRCGTCHLPDYRGREHIPRLAGQREEYLAEAMIGYRDGRRTGSDPIMAATLYGVPDADIRALAHYLARLP